MIVELAEVATNVSTGALNVNELILDPTIFDNVT
jgi:hypothetical protein